MNSRLQRENRLGSFRFQILIVYYKLHNHRHFDIHKIVNVLIGK